MRGKLFKGAELTRSVNNIMGRDDRFYLLRNSCIVNDLDNVVIKISATRNSKSLYVAGNAGFKVCLVEKKTRAHFFVSRPSENPWFFWTRHDSNQSAQLQRLFAYTYI